MRSINAINEMITESAGTGVALGLGNVSVVVAHVLHVAQERVDRSERGELCRRVQGLCLIQSIKLIMHSIS